MSTTEQFTHQKWVIQDIVYTDSEVTKGQKVLSINVTGYSDVWVSQFIESQLSGKSAGTLRPRHWVQVLVETWLFTTCDIYPIITTFHENLIPTFLLFYIKLRDEFLQEGNYITLFPDGWEPVDIESLNSSVVRALARYARGPRFESYYRHDFSPPVTVSVILSLIAFIMDFAI